MIRPPIPADIYLRKVNNRNIRSSWEICSKLTKLTIKCNWTCSCRLGPAGIYLLKVNNRNTRKRCEICSKLTIKIPERRLSLLTPFSSVSIVNFERVIAGWDSFHYYLSKKWGCYCQPSTPCVVEPAWTVWKQRFLKI